MDAKDKIQILVDRYESVSAAARRLGITPRRLYQVRRAGKATGALAVLLDELTTRPADCNVGEKVSQCN